MPAQVRWALTFSLLPYLVLDHTKCSFPEMKKVEELGFKPNNHARSLKQHVSSGYSMIVRGDGNLLFAGIIEG